VKNSLFYALSIVILFAACKKIAPLAPPEVYENAASQPEVSEIILPFEIPLEALESAVNSQVKGLIYEDSSMEDDNMAIKVWKKGSIEVSASGNTISYSIPLKVSLKIALKMQLFQIDLGETKETSFSLALKFKTRYNIDRNWNIQTVTQAEGYEWIKKPVVSVAGLSIPVTSIADKLVKDELDKFAGIIDEKAKPFLDITATVKDVWDALYEPIQISSDAPSAWLKLTPISISLSPVKGNNEKISALIGIKAVSETMLGRKPTPAIKMPLPALEMGNYKGSYFNIAITTDIPYENATSLATTTLLGKEFTFGKKGKKKIKIKDVDIYGSKEKLVIDLLVSGALNGRVYLSGTPAFDASTNKLYMKDFDYDFDTKNKLLKSANWLAHGLFVKLLKPYFEYDLSAELLDAKKQIQDNISNRAIAKNVFLSGVVDTFSPQKIALTRNSIKVVVVASGNAKITINGF